MRQWAMAGALLLLVTAPVGGHRHPFAAVPAGAAEGLSAALSAGGGELHPIFAPSQEEVATAARLGEQARRARKTVEELLDKWAAPVPEAKGKVVLMAPAARVAAAAYEAAKLHKGEAERAKAIERALLENRDMILFRVTLLGKGRGTWLWPGDLKPGDRKALESVCFALSDGKGHFFPPADPSAERKVEASSKTVGSPIPVTVYTHVKRFWFGLPILGSARRTDFQATYEVAFRLHDPKTGRPVLDPSVESLSLRIIGARGEKEVGFSLAALRKLTQGTRAGQR